MVQSRLVKKEKTLKDITFKFSKRKYNFVTERIIDGKRVQFFRGDNPKDEVMVSKEKGKVKIKKVKIKEWQKAQQ